MKLVVRCLFAGLWLTHADRWRRRWRSWARPSTTVDPYGDGGEPHTLDGDRIDPWAPISLVDGGAASGNVVLFRDPTYNQAGPEYRPDLPQPPVGPEGGLEVPGSACTTCN
jgi:hypothetical protein